jgi:hypothetical protein
MKVNGHYHTVFKWEYRKCMQIFGWETPWKPYLVNIFKVDSITLVFHDCQYIKQIK